ncbi:Glycosyltransferase involved in cell wall bisynthesis [Trichococcus flocculiformis]|uniref:glycosyltransferase n=1 Tax=Trichococcus TaxID=82802 RepID=UPI0007A86583|nr:MULTISPECIES: glycosyltransferase [Trichococcus]CZR05641.1 glycosyl transferases group 1 [Trichococcus sp. ES5]SHF88883.1 Glycosyltransferase involved in cell wall bisynthesis [Trichococcus flocculiformis]
MRVLQINAVYGIMSTGRTVLEMEKYLIKLGHESIVAYSEAPYSNSGYKIGGTFGKKIHGLFSRVTGLQGYFSSLSTRKFLKYIDDVKPDIVHVRNLHSNFINMGMLFDYLAKNDIATIITLHDCWFYSGGHTHYVKDKFYDWRDGFSKYNKNKKIMGNPSWFFDRSEKIFNDQVKWFTQIPRVSFVGVSNWITSEARQSKVTDRSHVQTIYNWIDLDTFHPVDDPILKEEMNIQNKFIILGVASGWGNNKGLDKFIELSNSLKDDECILLVGRVNESIHLPKNIINIPETHDIAELVRYYSISDVFVNLSNEESFGKVSAEALACGTPVITNNSTANPEIVGEGCGYIIDSFDDIRKRIDQIKICGKKSYSKLCVQFAHDNFDSRERMEDYVKLYTSLIESEV